MLWSAWFLDNTSGTPAVSTATVLYRFFSCVWIYDTPGALISVFIYYHKFALWIRGKIHHLIVMNSGEEQMLKTLD